MRKGMRDRMIRTVERELIWADAQQFERDNAHRNATRVVDALLEGPADGKAVERGLAVIREQAS